MKVCVELDRREVRMLGFLKKYTHKEHLPDHVFIKYLIRSVYDYAYSKYMTEG